MVDNGGCGGKRKRDEVDDQKWNESTKVLMHVTMRDLAIFQKKCKSREAQPGRVLQGLDNGIERSISTRDRIANDFVPCITSPISL